MIKGATIEFEQNFQQTRIPNQISCSNDEYRLINDEIEKFFAKGIIEESSHCDVEFISNIFPVAKKNGGIRIILNLKKLNEFVSYEHFKMEHLHTVTSLIEKDCFLASVDLQDAYYSVNIEESCRNYLKFFWNNKLYRFTCLAQGLSCAPRYFTKLMKPIFAKLRTDGHLSSYYLDDSLLLGNSELECSQNVDATCNILKNAGFIINEKKSCFIPSQEITYLGFILNSKAMIVSLPHDKKEKIFSICQNFKSKRIFVIREVATFVGLLVSSLPAVQYGRLNYRFLEHCKILALKTNKGDYDGDMFLDGDAYDEISWWSNNILHCFNPINPPEPSQFITTDASLLGWGAHFNGNSTGGQWTLSESVLHINMLELKAVLFGLQSFLSDSKDIHVRIKSDNMTAVTYINNLGGSRSISCHRITKEIWTWAISKNIHLSAEFLPGVENVLADRASRVFDENTEWQLERFVYEQLVVIFGEFDIDLFASRLNRQCDNYCSWKPDPKAKVIDAFSCSWNIYSNPYIFPPFSVIMKCLQKICQEQSHALLIAPLWPTQPWFPKLMRMIIKTPILLPQKILKLPFKPLACHKLHKNLRLIACPLSGDSTLSANFRNRQSILCVPHGENPPSFNINYILKNGCISVIDKKLIPCVIMK